MKSAGLILAFALLALGCNKAAEGSADSSAPSKEGASPAPSGGYAGVQALLTARCTGCHGENGKDGIDFRTYDSAMKGGKDGAVIVAGDPSASLIIKALRGLDGIDKMPKMGAPLTEEEIAMIEAWIKDGAKS